MLQGQPITLEYKMSPGEVLKYQTQVDSEQSLKEEGQSEQTNRSVLEMTMEQKVKEVNGGLSTVDVTIQEGRILREGETLELPAVGQTIGITMKRNGDIVKTTVDFPFSQPAFPDRTLKVGEKWTGDSKMDIPIMDREGNPTGSKSVTLTYHYTLAGFDRVAGYDVAIIQVECPQDQHRDPARSGPEHRGHRQDLLCSSRRSAGQVQRRDQNPDHGSWGRGSHPHQGGRRPGRHPCTRRQRPDRRRRRRALHHRRLSLEPGEFAPSGK